MPLRNSIEDEIAIATDKILYHVCNSESEKVELGEISKVVSGGTPSTKNYDYWFGEIVWITPKDLGQKRNIEISSSGRQITEVGLEKSSAKLLPVGTVLLSSRAPIGHLGISATPLATNQGFKNIICSDEINNRFLFHVLRASIDILQSRGRGNTFKEIPARIIKQLTIALPPLNIQVRVAEYLDAFYLLLAGKDTNLPDLDEPFSTQEHYLKLLLHIYELKILQEEIQRDLSDVVPNVVHAAINTT